MAGPHALGDPRRKVGRVIRAAQGNFEAIDAELEEHARAINLLVDALNDLKDYINSGVMENVADHTHGGGDPVDT